MPTGSSNLQNSVFTNVINPLKVEILTPLVYLLFAVALLYFLWGVIRYIYNADNEEARAKGQKHMIYGIVGIAIMLSVFGIMNLIFNTVTFGGAAKGINNQPAGQTKPGAVDSF